MKNIEKPATPDYYADLGVPEFAPQWQIRKAWRDQVKATHPDKQQTASSDAAGFRKVQEAYQLLTDPDRRPFYDDIYHEIKYAWSAYYREQEARRHAEEYARQRKEWEARLEAEAEHARRCREQQEEKERQEREREEKERAREAARIITEQVKVEWERIEKQKKHWANTSAARLESERIKAEYARNQAEAVRGWGKFSTNFRSACQSTIATTTPTMTTTNRSRCAHPKFQWPKKKGRFTCNFCEFTCSKWAFSCPKCSVLACPDCLDKFFREG